MSDNTIIAPTTDAATTEAIFIPNGMSILISADNLSGSEVVNVLVLQGSSYGASGIQLTASESARLLHGAGRYKLQKTATASGCGVYAGS